MAYVPINTQAYVSAYAGAVAGMAVSGWIVDPTSTHYAQVAAIAGAFSEAFDQVWSNAVNLNNLEVRAIQAVCQNEFAGRGPGSLDNPNFVLRANWVIPASACAALVLESDAYLAGQGINPGTPGGGSGKVLLVNFSSPANSVGAGQFLGPFGTEPHSVEARVQVSLPANYVLTDIQLHASMNGGVTGDTQGTLRINGSDTALTATISAGGQNADGAATVAYTAGQLLSVIMVLVPDTVLSEYSLAVYGETMN